MNRIRLITIVLLAGLMMTATACSKTVMQKPEPVEQEPEAAVQTVPAEAQPEPQPLPQTYDTSERDRALFLHEHVYFDFDSDVLRSDAKALLALKVQWLRENPDVIAVLIEGHCDERGSETYNLALGARRAQAVKAYLVDQGISTEQLNTTSLGETRPLDQRQLEEAWAKNRRVSFVIN